jgi:hypothetical protein
MVRCVISLITNQSPFAVKPGAQASCLLILPNKQSEIKIVNSESGRQGCLRSERILQNLNLTIEEQAFCMSGIPGCPKFTMVLTRIRNMNKVRC